MKVGFVGLGRMGQAMTQRLLAGGHEVGVYNRTAEKLKPLLDLGAQPMASIKDAANYGAAVFTMLSDDAALFDVVEQPGGLKESLPPGGVHICAGTHSVAAVTKLTAMHTDAGQFLITMPVLGRPEVTLAGQSAVLVAGTPDKVEHCRPSIAAISRTPRAGSRRQGSVPCLKSADSEAAGDGSFVGGFAQAGGFGGL